MSELSIPNNVVSGFAEGCAAATRAGWQIRSIEAGFDPEAGLVTIMALTETGDPVTATSYPRAGEWTNEVRDLSEAYFGAIAAPAMVFAEMEKELLR
jgi:hypothetical protein